MWLRDPDGYVVVLRVQMASPVRNLCAGSAVKGIAWTPWTESAGEKRPAKEGYFDVAYIESDREEAQQ